MLQIIPENLINSLINNLKPTYDEQKRSKAYLIASIGLYAMELLIKPKEPRVFQHWEQVAKGRIEYKLENKMIKLVKSFFTFLSVVSGIIGVVNLSCGWVFGAKVFGSVFLAVIAVITFRAILGTITAKKYRAQVENEMQKIKQTVTPEEIFEEIKNNYAGLSTDDSIRTYCRELCNYLKVDPDEFEIDLGKASGGNSTFIGWGSGGAVAGGLALSGLSALNAKAENHFINKRIKEIEAMIFYNNLASYFNTYILPKTDISDVKFLFDSI